MAYFSSFVYSRVRASSNLLLRVQAGFGTEGRGDPREGSLHCTSALRRLHLMVLPLSQEAPRQDENWSQISQGDRLMGFTQGLGYSQVKCLLYSDRNFPRGPQPQRFHILRATRNQMGI